MTKEQIIAGLDCMSRYTCEGCPNYTDRNCPEVMTTELVQAALELLKDDEKLIADYQRWHENQKNTIKELLKAQEARVMTLEEVKSLERDAVVWYEHNGVNKPRPRIVDQVYDSGIIFTDGGHWQFNADAYGKKFRLWTSRPDQATREAIPWE